MSYLGRKNHGIPNVDSIFNMAHKDFQNYINRVIDIYKTGKYFL